MINDFGINRTMIKIIALITMTIDHIGLMLFPNYHIFRIIGRIAMPLFCYMIAEGAYHTHNRKKYLLSIFVIGFICFLVYLLFLKQFYFNILISFSFSLILIYSYDNITESCKIKNKKSFILYLLLFITIFIISCFLGFCDKITGNSSIYMDYSIFPVFIPFLVYLGFKNKWIRFLLFFLGVLALYCYYEFVEHSPNHQMYSLISVLIIFFYSGKKGKFDFKSFFYLYYPLHLVVLYLIRLFI